MGGGGWRGAGGGGGGAGAGVNAGAGAGAGVGAVTVGCGRDCERPAADRRRVEFWGRAAGIRAKVIEAAEAEEGAVRTVEVLCAVFAIVVFHFAEQGAAVGKGAVAHGGYLQ